MFDSPSGSRGAAAPHRRADAPLARALPPTNEGRETNARIFQSADATFHTGRLEETLDSCLAAAAGGGEGVSGLASRGRTHAV